MRRTIQWKTFSAIIALTIIMASCGQSPNEKALRERISTMQHAIEQKDLNAMMQSVSSGAQVSSPDTGDLDRDGLRRSLSAVLLTYPKISIASTIRELHIQGKTAGTTIDVVAGAGVSGLPETVRHFTFHLDWLHDGSDWKMIRARWERP